MRFAVNARAKSRVLMSNAKNAPITDFNLTFFFNFFCVPRCAEVLNLISRFS